ncbi:MAG: hypothetical protein WCA39_18440, partial [Nitrososphaeraceae archaeon]
MVLSSEALAILLRYSVDNNEIANRVKSIDRVKALLFLYMYYLLKLVLLFSFVKLSFYRFDSSSVFLLV